MAGIDVKTVTMKFMDLIDYAIYHAPLLRNHKEFGERMRDVRFEIGSIEENYQRVLLAAKGRGMVSEMLNMEEAVVLVCGLHDKVLRLEAAQQSVQPTAFGDGKRGHLANLLVSLGKYLVKIGGG